MKNQLLERLNQDVAWGTEHLIITLAVICFFLIKKIWDVTKEKGDIVKESLSSRIKTLEESHQNISKKLINIDTKVQTILICFNGQGERILKSLKSKE